MSVWIDKEAPETLTKISEVAHFTKDIHLRSISFH